MARLSLSALVDAASGRLGEQVIVSTRGGPVAKRRPRYRQFPHPEAAAARERMRLAAEAWNEMSPAQVEAWRAYARCVTLTNPINGRQYSPQAYNVFSGLAARFLLANPGGAIPTAPPSAPFAGEGVTLSVEPSGGTGVVFTASGPNSPGVVTELLFQRLPNPRRSPVAFYKSLAIHTFEPGSLELFIPLDPGAYAFAYRFLQSATGLATDEQKLSVVLLETLLQDAA